MQMIKEAKKEKKLAKKSKAAKPNKLMQKPTSGRINKTLSTKINIVPKNPRMGLQQTIQTLYTVQMI